MDLICDITSSIECTNCKDVFNYYNKRKYEIINSLDVSNIFKLDTDNSCMWNMGSYRRNITNKLTELEVSSKKFFKCKNCRILEYLVHIGSGSKDQRNFPIIFKCKGILSAELSEVKNVGTITYKRGNIIYLDYFTNGIIINWYLESININLQKNYYSFVCNNNGYKISENINIITFDKIPNNKILSIICQICELLTKLEKYNFCIHGGIHSLFIIDSSFNIMLKDLSKCSLQINQNIISPYEIINCQETYNIKSIKYESLENIRNLYRLSNLKGVINSNIIGSIRSSLNLYLVLYHLMSFKNISNYIYEYEETYKIWKNLWIKSDFDNLKFDINDLENFRLREDALNFVIREVKKLC